MGHEHVVLLMLEKEVSFVDKVVFSVCARTILFKLMKKT